jgi:hypothetical protein
MTDAHSLLCLAAEKIGSEGHDPAAEVVADVAAELAQHPLFDAYHPAHPIPLAVMLIIALDAALYAAWLMLNGFAQALDTHYPPMPPRGGRTASAGAGRGIPHPPPALPSLAERGKRR